MTTGLATYPSLAGRAVLVTGGASGIGADIVRAFVRNKAKVAFLDIADAAADALLRDLPGARYYRCNLLETAELQAAIARVAGDIGPIRVLVNNAANDDRKTIGEIDEAYWDWSQNVNLRHMAFAAQAVHGGMTAAGGGSIINLSSTAWRFGMPALVAYATAKAGVIGLTKSLARTYGPDNIRVNAIEPGAIMTEKQRTLWYKDQASIDRMISMQSIPTIMNGTDVANMVLFLAADDSRLITRQTFVVDAGIS